MGFVVIGLSPEVNVRPLHDALAAAGLPTERLDILEATDIELIGGSPLAGTELLTSDGGAHVPGLNATRITAHPDDTIATKLSELNIPDSELENYIEALANGRSVVSYTATSDTAEKVSAVFRSAGLLNVRQF